MSHYMSTYFIRITPNTEKTSLHLTSKLSQFKPAQLANVPCSAFAYSSQFNKKLWSRLELILGKKQVTIVPVRIANVYFLEFIDIDATCRFIFFDSSKKLLDFLIEEHFISYSASLHSKFDLENDILDLKNLASYLRTHSAAEIRIFTILGPQSIFNNDDVSVYEDEILTLYAFPLHFQNLQIEILCISNPQIQFQLDNSWTLLRKAFTLNANYEII